MTPLLKTMLDRLGSILDFFFEAGSVMLGLPIEQYYVRRLKRQQKRLDSLKKTWDHPAGTIVMLQEDTWFNQDEPYSGTRVWFDKGYSPMLMKIRWPELSDEFHQQTPIIFVFWCSGKTLRYEFKIDRWNCKLPFDVI